MDKTNVIRAGVFGTVIGDALGVPVEFAPRTMRVKDPVVDMREYGVHNQPKGTWSDDSSMLLATMDSMVICKGMDYADIMERFQAWIRKAEYTAHGRVFDIGITCSSAVRRYEPGVNPLDCGGAGERDNGNGSLMRIMPVSLYDALRSDFREDAVLAEAVTRSHYASCLTHRHPRSQMACGIYTAVCHELIYRDGRSIAEALQSAMDLIMDYYSKADVTATWYDQGFQNELAFDTYGRLRDIASFGKLTDREIKSGGYVVHTLEAAIWCLLNTASFEECTLKAVNLGDDTDTVGAVAGGLAGLAYGYESIPGEWLEVIAKRDWIDKLCVDLSELINA